MKMSGSSLPGSGAGPSPMNPFSDWKKTCRPSGMSYYQGRDADPRFTRFPSQLLATRRAMKARCRRPHAIALRCGPRVHKDAGVWTTSDPAPVSPLPGFPRWSPWPRLPSAWEVAGGFVIDQVAQPVRPYPHDEISVGRFSRKRFVHLETCFPIPLRTQTGPGSTPPSPNPPARIRSASVPGTRITSVPCHHLAPVSCWCRCARHDPPNCFRQTIAPPRCRGIRCGRSGEVPHILSARRRGAPAIPCQKPHHQDGSPGQAGLGP